MKQQRWLIVGLGALVLLFVAFVGRRVSPGVANSATPGQPKSSPRRIISLAPSITEVLFALGLGDSVVGVTRFCTFPPEAASKDDVGGYYDPNYEAIAMLKPDLVVCMPEHEKPREYLAAMGVETLTVSHQSIAEILASVRTIGAKAGVRNQAETLVTELEQRIDEAATKTRGLSRPAVLIALGRDVELDRIEDVYVAGQGGWYEELVELAGGVNAYDGGLPFPSVSAEGILSMNPDVIIEVLGDITRTEVDYEHVGLGWRSLPQVSAVQAKRVHLLHRDFALIPGPRFVQILDEFIRALHPELIWSDHEISQ